ncbi:hypothetical protein IQ268_09210 [Oculatella sp. LEGE 06141]|uniref:hypothetical protein n=1 Tax=Oculatella sp. LEGE 06141 TaxID=1828648 RepID=UPI0019F51BD8|nr:hypothetical protein [Oculatella sp. LEGE 06141]
MTIQTVFIPSTDEHEGVYFARYRVKWVCPACGGQRGEIFPIRSYDGSRSQVCDGWRNPCGHIDRYSQVRQEAATNGLNLKAETGGSSC